MPLSLGPPPIAAESSRFQKEEKIDAGSALAEREQFMARRAMHSGSPPSDRGVWRSCSSDKRGGVEGGGGEGRGEERNVRFTKEDVVTKTPTVIPTSIKKWNVDNNTEVGKHGEPFPWVCVLIIIIILILGSSIAYCSWHKPRVPCTGRYD